MPSHKDRVIIVTGAAGAIGYATAGILAAQGARVVMVDIAASLEERAAELARVGDADFIRADCASETDVRAALDSIAAGPVQEGNCGGGTGMITYGFKGGTGTSSRIVQFDGRTYTIGTLVQANHGQRDWLTIAGVPVGQVLRAGTPQSQLKERGSIIVVIAAGLPLAPHQLKRLARRAAIGIGRNGTPGGNNSGDIFLAFSTANAHPMAHRANGHLPLEIVNDEPLDPVYMAAVDSVEEAVVNAMLAAEDMGGTPYDRLRIQAIPHEQLAELIRQYGRMGA